MRFSWKTTELFSEVPRFHLWKITEGSPCLFFRYSDQYYTQNKRWNHILSLTLCWWVIMGDFLIIQCLNCFKISQKQAWQPIIYFAWMTSMYFREYFCRFSRKSHYFYILGVSHLNSLPPSDAIWQQIYRPIMAEVMACCLMATSHYLNQCWLTINKIIWHSF